MLVRHGTSRLPAGYQELSYIKSTGTQYINTGYFANNNTKLLMEFKIDKFQTDFSVALAPFGARTAWQNNQFALMMPVNAKNKVYYCYQAGSRDITANIPIKKLKANIAGNVWNVGGIARSFSAVTFTTAYPLYLFNCNAAGSIWETDAELCIYSCTISEGDTVIRDYVPCITPGGTVGMYDLVRKAAYGNPGTGAFVPGDYL